MLNIYIILCFLALVALNDTMSTNSTDSSQEDSSSNQIKFINLRELQNKIDGATHYIKSASITYRQRVKNDQCLVEYDKQLLSENTVIKIRRKVFRVENCLLERVYHACGPNLLLMLGVVCRVLDRDSATHALVNFKRQASLSTNYYFDSTADHKKQVISESCCENLCSVPELTRYCHK